MKKIIFLIIILAIIAVSFYFYKSDESIIDNGNILTATSTDTTSSTTTDKYNIGGLQYEIVDNNATTSLSNLNIDTLNREIVFPKENPPEINKKHNTDINKIISFLKENPNNFDKWIELGVYRKTIQDYDGAKEAWENASLIRPNSALPVSNIGNLLGYYMKDPVGAEKYYLRSVSLEPNVGFWYYQTFMFYTEVLKDNTKAKSILEEGVKNNPADNDLNNILKSL